MKKLTIIAGATVALALTPTVASAHLGDYFTQLNNATVACASRFDGCRYLSHTSGGADAHQQLFLFSRDGQNGRTCFQQYIVNHNNVVTDDVFMGCR